jgi:hypothetical protein
MMGDMNFLQVGGWVGGWVGGGPTCWACDSATAGCLCVVGCHATCCLCSCSGLCMRGMPHNRPTSCNAGQQAWGFRCTDKACLVHLGGLPADPQHCRRRCFHSATVFPACLPACLQSLVNFPKEAINDETVELLQVGVGAWMHLAAGGWAAGWGRSIGGIHMLHLPSWRPRLHLRGSAAVPCTAPPQDATLPLPAGSHHLRRPAHLCPPSRLPAALLCRPRLQLRVSQEGVWQRGGAVQLGRQHVQVP